METTSQVGTDMEYQIFIDANIIFVNGQKLVLHLTKEEYQSFNTTIAEECYKHWRFLRESKDRKTILVNEWIFLDNVMRVSYSEVAVENDFIGKLRTKKL